MLNIKKMQVGQEKNEGREYVDLYDIKDCINKNNFKISENVWNNTYDSSIHAFRVKDDSEHNMVDEPLLYGAEVYLGDIVVDGKRHGIKSDSILDCEIVFDGITREIGDSDTINVEALDEVAIIEVYMTIGVDSVSYWSKNRYNSGLINIDYNMPVERGYADGMFKCIEDLHNKFKFDKKGTKINGWNIHMKLKNLYSVIKNTEISLTKTYNNCVDIVYDNTKVADFVDYIPKKVDSVANINKTKDNSYIISTNISNTQILNELTKIDISSITIADDNIKYYYYVTADVLALDVIKLVKKGSDNLENLTGEYEATSLEALCKYKDAIGLAKGRSNGFNTNVIYYRDKLDTPFKATINVINWGGGYEIVGNMYRLFLNKGTMFPDFKTKYI